MNTDEVKQQSDAKLLAQVSNKESPNQKKNKSMVSIENFSNEIFYEIFDYLEFSDIYQAFSNLNVRFQQLINSSSLLVKFFFPCRPKFDVEYYCENIIQPNRHRIISLRNLTSPMIQTLFTKHCALDQSFSCLERLAFFRVSIVELTPLLVCLKLLPRLSSLTISIDHFTDFEIDLSVIYRATLALPTLKYLEVDAHGPMLNDTNIFSNSEKFSSIEYLTMNNTCFIDGLTAILKCTPRLRHLTCASLYYSNESLDNDVPLVLPDLTYFWIYYCTVPFDHFREFIEKNFSQLKVFRINTFSNEDYIDPDRWKPLILENMPRLRRFHFTYDLNWNDDFVDEHFDSFVHHFSSPFWLKRNIDVQLYFTSGSIKYTLQSRSLTDTARQFEEFLKSIKTSSDEIIQHSSTQDDSPDQLHAPISLDTFYEDDPWSASFMNSASFILSAIPITNLHIGMHKMPVSLFIKVIRSLPNLNELRVPELSLDLLDSLSAEEQEDLHYFSRRNKVANVSHTAEATLTPFLMNLCPRMKYLEMFSSHNKSPEAFMRYVLKNCATHTPGLNLMNIWIYGANDRIVRILQNMIDSENLLSNYIIKHCGDNVVIKWNSQG